MADRPDRPCWPLIGTAIDVADMDALSAWCREHGSTRGVILDMRSVETGWFLHVLIALLPEADARPRQLKVFRCRDLAEPWMPWVACAWDGYQIVRVAPPVVDPGPEQSDDSRLLESLFRRLRRYGTNLGGER